MLEPAVLSSLSLAPFASSLREQFWVDLCLDLVGPWSLNSGTNLINFASTELKCQSNLVGFKHHKLDWSSIMT